MECIFSLSNESIGIYLHTVFISHHRHPPIVLFSKQQHSHVTIQGQIVHLYNNKPMGFSHFEEFTS